MKTSRNQYHNLKRGFCDTTIIKEKTFGKIVNCKPKTQRTQEKINDHLIKTIRKSRPNRNQSREHSFDHKIQITNKSSNHSSYFIQPKEVFHFSKNQFDKTIVPQIRKTQQIIKSKKQCLNNTSLNWNQIKSFSIKGFVSKLMRNYSPLKSQTKCFCSCNDPCIYATKWKKWAQKPQSFLYQRLQQKPLSQALKIQIKKDLKRTHSKNSFQHPRVLNKLQQILQTYCKYDEQTSYIQGMNLIGSIIIYHVKQSQQSFWIFVNLMQKSQFKNIYKNQFKELTSKHIIIINKLIKSKIYDLYCHFVSVEVSIDPILLGWFLSMMLKLIPLQYGHLVINTFINQGWTSLYKLIITYLVYLKQQLIQLKQASQILYRLSFILNKQEVDWQQMIETSQNICI